MKHACLACIIFGLCTEEYVRAYVHTCVRTYIGCVRSRALAHFRTHENGAELPLDAHDPPILHLTQLIVRVSLSLSLIHSLSLSPFPPLSFSLSRFHPRRTVTDRWVNRGRHSAHLAALLAAYLRLHRGAIGFPAAREMGARNGLSVTRKKPPESALG